MRYGDSQLFDFHTFSNRHHWNWQAGALPIQRSKERLRSFSKRERKKMLKVSYDIYTNAWILWRPNHGMISTHKTRKEAEEALKEAEEALKQRWLNYKNS